MGVRKRGGQARGVESRAGRSHRRSNPDLDCGLGGSLRQERCKDSPLPARCHCQSFPSHPLSSRHVSFSPAGTALIVPSLTGDPGFLDLFLSPDPCPQGRNHGYLVSCSFPLRLAYTERGAHQLDPPGRIPAPLVPLVASSAHAYQKHVHVPHLCHRRPRGSRRDRESARPM